MKLFWRIHEQIGLKLFGLISHLPPTRVIDNGETYTYKEWNYLLFYASQTIKPTLVKGIKHRR